MKNNKNDDCIFCFSLLFSFIKIEYNDIPVINSECYLKHQKQIDFSKFSELNNKSFDNIKLKIECPFCKEILDKDVFFIKEKTKTLICPKCIALNIVLSSSSNKKKKGKKKNNIKKDEPHYSTLISLLKESLSNEQEKTDNNYFDEKNIDKEKIDINEKYKNYRDIIFDEKHLKMLDKIYSFVNIMNYLKKKILTVYRENKGYLPKRFYDNIKNIYSFNDISKIFLNDFSLINDTNNNFISKEIKIVLKSLNEHYKSVIENGLFINKILLNQKNNKIKCIYQHESIISYILNFEYEISTENKEYYLIISSNNGIISILNADNYKIICNLDIFQSKGVYYLTQCKKEKNTFYASSWGCFKKIKLTKDIINENMETTSFAYTIIKSYKKLDIIRILKLIEIPNNFNNINIQNEIISLDEGGHIIVWGYNQKLKKDIKEEIFVAEREDSINNLILFESNKISDKLIFTTRNSTLFGSIHFYNIEDEFYELKCMKNSYKNKSIYFDLQYNTLTQLNDTMIIFPQNKKFIVIDVKNYQIVSIVELQTDLEKEKFYNINGETVAILNYPNISRLLLFSLKRYVYEFSYEDNLFLFSGKTILDDLKDEVEMAFKSYNNIDSTNGCIYIKLNKKILLINMNQE